jgi:uncharacterized OsmC-like protein
MKSEELKKIQKPLKDYYREFPEKAIITLKSEGTLGEGISCRIETGKLMAEAGLHSASGGTGMMVCSGDMLLEALVACAGVTLGAVSTSIGLEIKKGTIRAEGDLDFRGTLGVSKDAPVGFKAIRLFFDLESNATEDQIKTLAKLTERYCIVYQTIAKGVQIESKYQNNSL